ncbi:Beta-barrel assembly-enhancing protease [Gammaproteobacteria bacterium]|nr:MAG: M48 family metallopeptidase [Gammaproteobacteria bacterium]CAG0941972.1 Beta-barrel assembly-enhancing protease [Gammaproteobacteria bacterium]
MRFRRLVALACSLATAFAPVLAANEDLPDIGSPADTVLSRDMELQIGRSIYKSLRDTGKVITDPEIQEYIQDIGQKIAANATDNGQRFRFFVVDDPAINAFALPGGFVGIHSGLLMATATESELAGVLAHEISHVTQRHISRAIYANQRASILTMAALLGAILLGAATGSGEAIQGAVAAAQGAAAQQQINFTRSNEYEADRVGVGLMASAGFDPAGMANFFETLARQSGPLASQAPEFLRTHPVTVNRIAEARERVAQFPRQDITDATGYRLARARLRVLTSTTPEAALARFESDMHDPRQVGDIGLEYGLALARLQTGDPAHARDEFASLVDSHPGVIAFHSGLAMAEMSVGDEKAAFATFERAMRLFPRNVPLTVRYAEALMQHGRAREAHRVLLDLLNAVAPTPEQVRLIALAASAAGDTGDAHYYMAEYHLMGGDLNLAADELRVALGIPGLDPVQKARFSSRLSEIQQVLNRLQSEKRRSRAAGETGFDS